MATTYITKARRAELIDEYMGATRDRRRGRPGQGRLEAANNSELVPEITASGGDPLMGEQLAVAWPPRTNCSCPGRKLRAKIFSCSRLAKLAIDLQAGAQTLEH